MKRLFLLLMIVFTASVLTLSCCDYQKEMKIKQQDYQVGSVVLLNAFISIRIDKTIANEVLNQINMSIEKGLDEIFYLKELWLDEPQVKVSLFNNAPLLKKRLEDYFSTRSKGNDLLDFIKTSNWVIYWPYSENWDGYSLPVITPVPENIKQNWNYGYRITFDDKGNQMVEQVYVDDDFAFDNPVWIIKEGFDYNNLPNFNQGESIKNGISFLSPNTKTGLDTINIWTFHQAQVTKQYDSLFEGASNFKLTVTYPVQEGSVNANSIHLFSFLRSQIRKKQWKTLDLLLNSDWTEQQISNGLHIVETDGGVEEEQIMVTKYKLLGIEYEVTNRVKYQNEDDFIDCQVFARTYIRSPLGRGIQNCDGGGFKYKTDWTEYTY